MSERDWPTERFESERAHLRAVALRMLGSAGEADDAVQEAWLRLRRSDVSGVDSLRGWLTTVVSRVCLDMLRSRTARREDPLDAAGAEPAMSSDAAGPEDEAVLADALGSALLIVLDTLAPAERVALVLHDTFGVSFEEIAPIVGRKPAAARQLASRARRRVRASAGHGPDLDRQRPVVEAFLAAARQGDLGGLVAVLDPEVVFRCDPAAMELGRPSVVRGSAEVAEQFSGRAQTAEPALLDGTLGIAVAPDGHLLLVLELTIRHGRIVEIAAVADPGRLEALEVIALRT